MGARVSRRLSLHGIRLQISHGGIISAFENEHRHISGREILHVCTRQKTNAGRSSADIPPLQVSPIAQLNGVSLRQPESKNDEENYFRDGGKNLHKPTFSEVSGRRLFVV